MFTVFNDFQIKFIWFETKKLVRVLGFGLGFVLFCYGCVQWNMDGSKTNQCYAVGHASGSQADSRLHSITHKKDFTTGISLTTPFLT